MGIRFKDPNFLAATERDMNRNPKERADSWADTLGLNEEKGPLAPLSNLFKSSSSLEKVESIEVVGTEGNKVEFKIRCGDGKTLHEKSIMREDKKWGYIFSGDSEFESWE